MANIDIEAPGASEADLREALSSLTRLGVANWDADKGKLIRAQMSRAITGLAATVIAGCGDSTEAGTPGGTNGVNTITPVSGQQYKFSSQYRMYEELTRRLGANAARYDGCFIGSAHVDYDDRLTGYNTNWSNFSGYLRIASALGNSITFAPTKTSDTIEVVWLDLAAAGTLRVICNDGTDGTNVDTVTNNNGLYKKTTVTASQSGKTLGQNTWKIQGSSGVCFGGCHTYDSTVKDIRIVNMGIPGITARDRTTAVNNDILNMWKILAPNMSFVNLGVNDNSSGPGAGSGTFGAGLLRVCQAMDDSGPVIVESGNWNLGQTDASILEYQAAAYAALGTAYPIIDRFKMLGNTKAGVTASGLQPDNLHPTTTEYDGRGRFRSDFLLRAR